MSWTHTGLLIIISKNSWGRRFTIFSDIITLLPLSFPLPGIATMEPFIRYLSHWAQRSLAGGHHCHSLSFFPTVPLKWYAVNQVSLETWVNRRSTRKVMMPALGGPCISTRRLGHPRSHHTALSRVPVYRASSHHPRPNNEHPQLVLHLGTKVTWVRERKVLLLPIAVPLFPTLRLDSLQDD